MYGSRARIGYTSPPSATEVFPYEFYKIVPDGVTLVVHTLPLTDKSGDEVDRSYDASERAAKVMARAGIDIMVFGGVPILASRGFATAEQMVRETEKTIGRPVITSASAQKDALAAVGARTSRANGGQISVSGAEPWSNPAAPRQPPQQEPDDEPHALPQEAAGDGAGPVGGAGQHFHRELSAGETDCP